MYKDSTASEYVFNQWPGEIIFTGSEIGEKIFTGLKLIKSDIMNSPVKDVFRINITNSAEENKGHMSWDETAVLIAVYGIEGFFETRRGNIIVKSNGTNSWEDSPAGKDQYVIQKMTAEEMSKFIEDRIMHQPLKK